MTSVHHWPLLTVAVGEFSPRFSPCSDTDLSGGSLALPNWWRVEGAYAKLRRAHSLLIFSAYLSFHVWHGTVAD